MMADALPANAASRRAAVADSSALIGMATAGVFAALRELFASVTITRPVLEEVRAGGALPGARELDAALRAGWIRVAPTPAATWEHPDLGAGEASTIALALGHDAGRRPLVLMDDVEGTARARALGLDVLTLDALLLAAGETPDATSAR